MPSSATSVTSKVPEDFGRAKREVQSNGPTIDPNLMEIFGYDESDQDDDIQAIFRCRVHITSAKFSGFLTPFPLAWIKDQFIVLNSRNLPFYICFRGTPFPPLTADIIFTCPLR